LGLSQARLAEKISVTRCQIADYETRRTRVAADDWERIKALVPVDDKGQGAETP